MARLVGTGPASRRDLRPFRPGFPFDGFRRSRWTTMGLQAFIKGLDASGDLVRIRKPVRSRLEAAAVLNALGDRPVLFERIEGSEFPVVGNLFGNKAAFARYFAVEPREVIPRMLHAIEHPSRPRRTGEAPCQEVVEEAVDLDRLPILFHAERDGGRYVTSGVFVTRSRDGIQNVDFHRAMQLDRQRFSIRVVEGRNFDTLLKRDGELPVAVCVGNVPNVLLAGACSVPLGQDELEIANSLEPLLVTKALTFDAWIPADCQFVLEGVVRLEEREIEGPFVDLTGTYDEVRREPVLRVTCVSRRRDAFWQALLPGGREHKMLMGMPREPTIWREVERAGVRCLDVNIDPGGCSWLHAVVQIDKRREDDGRRAIEAGFRGHTSCKHLFVVDRDIDIYDPLDVEWALATRFQADRDLVVRKRERGSSLDPSAEPGTALTTKCGFDCTRPLGPEGGRFEKADFPRIDLKKLLD